MQSTNITASNASDSMAAAFVCTPAVACSCMCSEHRDPYSVARRALLPRCRSGEACRGCTAVQQQHSSYAGAAIVIVYAYKPDRVRSLYQQAPLGQYLKDMMLIVRLVLSLRRVGTTLPIHLLLAGERREKFERILRELGVQVSDSPYIRPAPWANSFHAGSFAKLHALALGQFDRVLVLDLDCVVLRNIDHMAAWPTPSFRYQTVESGRECLWELQSGVLLIRPDAHEHARAMRMTAPRSSPLAGDRGDQSVWRALYANSTVHELPTAYNAFKYELDDAREWESVFVLHDGWTMRWRGKWSDAHPAVGVVLAGLTANATRLMKGASNPWSNLNLSAASKSMRTCYFQRLRGRSFLRICDRTDPRPAPDNGIDVRDAVDGTSTGNAAALPSFAPG
eukprot:4928748-Prymnesium_polylepis.1